MKLWAVMGCGLALAVTGATPVNGTTYTLMQMNLCLSGLAGCYHPAVVEEAMARIREAHPDAITFNEACQGDVALIARRTGASCAPGGAWIRSDRSARQDPGLQQVYGTGALSSPSAEVVPAVHTDHDILLVRAHLPPQT